MVGAFVFCVPALSAYSRPMIRALVLLAFAIAALLLACSSSSNAGTSRGEGAIGSITCTGSPTTVNGLESESSSFGCGNSLALHGDAGTGAACQSADDCSPTCCACPAGKKYNEALVVACVNGKCADAQTVCCALVGDIQSEPAGSTGPCD